MTTDNYKKHTAKNPLQRLLIEWFFEALLNEVEKLKPDTILDAGCGEGFTLERLRKRNIGTVLEGVDIGTVVELGKKVHPQLQFKEGSIYRLPYEDNAFDVVLCTEVLEHLERPEDALAELRRVTKRYCVITVPNEPFFMLANFLRGKNLSRWGNDIEHIQHWSFYGMRTFVGKLFTVNTVRLPFPWMLIVAEK